MLGLVVVEDALGGSQDEIAELSGGEDVGGPSLKVVQRDIEPGGDDAALVDSSEELDDDLPGSVVVNDFKFSDVPSLLHKLQELD